MNINADTRISFLIKNHPDALNSIISISPRFVKLKNPLLRKLMAGRTSIGMACKVAGCDIQDFFEKLLPLGFQSSSISGTQEDKDMPSFMHKLETLELIEFDVRPLFENDSDPLAAILDKIKSIREGQVLKILNTFEPVPLISLLKKLGYDSFTNKINEYLFATFFHHTHKIKFSSVPSGQPDDWDDLINRFSGKMKQVDVRQLKMPLPMMTILSELESLALNNALLVDHKRIPVLLLPELKDRHFSHRYRTLDNGEIQLLIFRN